MSSKGAATKQKRRNSEKRKEKSRDAARCRRSRESAIFADLASALPLPSSIVSTLDKASIMRLVLSTLRMIKFMEKENFESKYDKYDSLYLEAIDGFVFVLTQEGEIIFISNDVTNYLGLTQVDLLGQSIYEVTHPCDHGNVEDVLAVKTVQNSRHLSMLLRFKCATSQKSRSLHLKSHYKVMHVNGKIVEKIVDEAKTYSFVSIASPIPHPKGIEIPLGKFTFLSKHSLNMKYTYADENMTEFLGYKPEFLIGKSLYEYPYVEDNQMISSAFKDLFAKGQTETECYRFLAQGGGYAWVITQATVIYCEKTSKPLSVVCVNFIVSGREEESKIFSLEQLEWSRNNPPQLEPVKKLVSTTASFFSPLEKEKSLSSTLSTFGPKTSDMNKGFWDDEYSSSFEEEDLTFLAPTAGPACIPLEPVVEELEKQNYSPLIDTEKKPPLIGTFRNESPIPSIMSQSSIPALMIPPLSISDDSLQHDETSVKDILGLDLDFDHDYASIYEDLPSLLPFNIDTVFNENSACSSQSGSPIPMELKDQYTQDPCSSTEVEKRKRLSNDTDQAESKRQHLNDSFNQGKSVLMNLLITGQDMDAGYAVSNSANNFKSRNSILPEGD